MRDHSSERKTQEAVTLMVEVRKKKGLSQQKVADVAGITRSAVGLIESGQRIPTLTTCFKIARALEVDLAELIKKAQKAAQ